MRLEAREPRPKSLYSTFPECTKKREHREVPPTELLYQARALAMTKGIQSVDFLVARLEQD